MFCANSGLGSRSSTTERTASLRIYHSGNTVCMRRRSRIIDTLVKKIADNLCSVLSVCFLVPVAQTTTSAIQVGIYGFLKKNIQSLAKSIESWQGCAQTSSSTYPHGKAHNLPKPLLLTDKDRNKYKNIA